METKYITVKIKPDKPRQRPMRGYSFLFDCALFGACVVGVYIMACAVLVLGRLV